MYMWHERHSFMLFVCILI